MLRHRNEFDTSTRTVSLWPGDIWSRPSQPSALAEALEYHTSMTEALSLHVQSIIEQLGQVQQELQRQAHMVYLPNGQPPLVQAMPLLTQRVDTLADDVVVLQRQLDTLDASMTTQHAVMMQEIGTLRLSLTKYVSVAVGAVVVLQAVLLPLVMKWGEKLLK